MSTPDESQTYISVDFIGGLGPRRLYQEHSDTITLLGGHCLGLRPYNIFLNNYQA